MAKKDSTLCEGTQSGGGGEKGRGSRVASVRERLEQEKCDRAKGNVGTMAMWSDGRIHCCV